MNTKKGIVLVLGVCLIVTATADLWNVISDHVWYELHTGLYAGLALFISIILAMKHSFIKLLIPSSILHFDELMDYHKSFAYVSTFLVVIHFIDHYKSVINNPWSIQVITGNVLLVLLIIILIVSLPYFRRKYYNSIFLASHWILVAGLLIIGWLHNAILIQISIAFIVWDIIARIYNRVRYSVKILNVELVGKDVIHIKFLANNFRYKAGQFITINIPQISFFQSHPFSLSSHPSDAVLSVHIKLQNKHKDTWTTKLINYLEDNDPEDILDKLQMNINGPFGGYTLRKPLTQYKYVIFISGGIGYVIFCICLIF